MLKKTKKILFSTLGVGAAIIATVPLAVVLSSCASTSTSTNTYANTFSYQTFNSLMANCHGRVAGNINNFKLSTGKDQPGFDIATNQLIGTNLNNASGFTSTDLEPLLLHPWTKGETLSANLDNYGSYHAFQYLQNTIASMGYTDNNPGQVTHFPGQGTVTSSTKEVMQNGKSVTKQVNTYNPATKTTYQNGIVTRSDDEKVLGPELLKTGYITQGFLWNGSVVNQAASNHNGVQEYNNVGANICVTINPTMKDPNNSVKDVFIISHYDSTLYSETAKGSKQRDYGDTIVGHQSWGATDNGSGVAVNLALLKYFSNPANRANLGVRLHILFSGAEEVGVKGTYAFVESFVKSKLDAQNQETNALVKNTLSVINMDTVAGGDRTYVHARGASPAEGSTPAITKKTLVRDQLLAVSERLAEQENNPSLALQLHPQLTRATDNADSYLEPGLTGDWSDHEPFYLQGLPVAYFESTNFDIWSKNQMYDGYSQVTNPAAWLVKDGMGNGKEVNLDPVKINNGILTEYNWPSQYLPNKQKGRTVKNTWLLTGDIWHSDFDTPQWMEEHFGNRIFKQMNTVYEILLAYLQSVYQYNSTTGFTYLNQGNPFQGDLN